MKKILKKKAVKKTVKKKNKPQAVKKVDLEVKKKAETRKLSAKEKKIYRELLLRKKQAITEEINHIAKETNLSPKDASGDMSSYTLHMADVATDTYDREFSMGLASNDRKVIQQIDEALKRLEDSTYGICQACGCKLNQARLKALPQAWLCVDCQEKLEQKP